MRCGRYGVLVAIVAGWGATPAASAAAFFLRSGFYEGFVLAVSPTGRVVGHFDMEQGEGVTKRCIFDFVGKATGNQATIRTVGAPGLNGRIMASAVDELTFNMARVRSLPGCGLIVPPEAEAAGGTELDRIKPGAWTDLATIKAPRVAFRAAPGGPAGRAYVVKGDVVGILARRGDQAQVVFPSERDTWAQGWVSVADLAPLAP